MNIVTLGRFRDNKQNTNVTAFHIIEQPAYGEKYSEIITISNSLEVGGHGCGEAGSWGHDAKAFSNRFTQIS